MAVDVLPVGTAFTAGQPRELFQAPPVPGVEFVVDNQSYFDVTPDGQRFLMIVPVDEAASQRIHVRVSDEPDQVARLSALR